jgi:hypothetical protein
MQAGCFKERESVESPGLPVEVDSEKPTSIIKKQRIDAEDKSCPRALGRMRSSPLKWHSTTSSFTGMKAWFVHSPHLTCGFPQTPRIHSLSHAGAFLTCLSSGSPIGLETRLSGPQRAAETARFCRPPMSCWSHHRVEGVRLAASLGAAPNATRASSARHPVRQAVAGSKQFLPVLPLLACPRLAKRRLHKLNGPLATDRGRPTPRASVLVDGRN